MLLYETTLNAVISKRGSKGSNTGLKTVVKIDNEKTIEFTDASGTTIKMPVDKVIDAIYQAYRRDNKE